MKIKFNDRDAVGYNIVVVGTGATGSHFLPMLCQLLANYENCYLTIVDGDIFEKKNLANQKCLPKDIGRLKAEVLCERYSGIFPNLNIAYSDDYIENHDQLIDLFNAFDRRKDTKLMPIILGCVDNNATRRIMQKAFDSAYDCIYIDVGNGTDDMQGQAIVGLRQKEYVGHNTVSKVILPTAPMLFPDIIDDPETLEEAVGCDRMVDEHPQHIATNMMSATVLFSIFNRIISDNEIISHMTFFDAANVSIKTRTVQNEIDVKLINLEKQIEKLRAKLKINRYPKGLYKIRNRELSELLYEYNRLALRKLK